MTSLAYLESSWKSKYEQLEKDTDNFKKEFIKNKKCSCKNYECIHYKKEEKKIFMSRLNSLLKEGMLLNALTVYSTMKQILIEV